ncbi:general secretion pathway protein GspK [bacterium]|nr:general secretion pathway protein GspK [candidate division CSSED10-310 bacterium]
MNIRRFEPPRFRNDDGFSVVIVLAVMTAIFTLALCGARTAAGRREIAAMHADRVAVHHANHSGLALAVAIIQSDTTAWDGPGDTWYPAATVPIGDLIASITVEDEQARLPVHYLLRPSGDLNEPVVSAFRNVFPTCIIDRDRWANDRNRWEQTHHDLPISALAAIRLLGITDPDADRFVTVYGTGRININTADPKMLEALGGSAFSRAVVRARSRQALTSVFDLSESVIIPPGVVSILDTRSSCFRITISTPGRFVIGRLEAVVWRQGSNILVLDQKEWWTG